MGVDTEGGVVGPLRLWQREEGDVKLGGAYVVRGLRVVNDRAWDSSKCMLAMGEEQHSLFLISIFTFLIYRWNQIYTLFLSCCFFIYRNSCSENDVQTTPELNRPRVT
jgi:hypothetical protein